MSFPALLILWLYNLPTVPIWRWAEGLEARVCPQKPAVGHTRNSDQRMGLEVTKHHEHCSPPPQDSRLHKVRQTFQPQTQYQPVPFFPFLLKTLKIQKNISFPPFGSGLPFVFLVNMQQKPIFLPRLMKFPFFFWGFTAGIKCFTQQQMGVF